MLGAPASSIGALAGHRSPTSSHFPPHPTGSSSRRTVAACARWAGLWPGWMDVCLALGRSQSPLPRRDDHLQPCPSALQGSLPWSLLPIVQICQTSDAPVTSRASGSWGPWLGPLLTSLPGSATCLGALADSGLPPSTIPFRPLGNRVCAQTPPTPPHRWSEGARAWDLPAEGLQAEAACLLQSPVLQMLAELLADLSTLSRHQSGGTFTWKSCVCSHLPQKRDHGHGCPDRGACPRPMAAETNYYKLGA